MADTFGGREKGAIGLHQQADTQGKAENKITGLTFADTQGKAENKITGLTFADTQGKAENKITGLTFAEAYILRKEQEKNRQRDFKRRASEGLSQITNIADIHASVQKIIKHLLDDTKNSSKKIKTILKSMPAYLAKHVTAWHDENELDLLHHFIIHNKADLIAFVLGETLFYPIGYVPPSNPYAHLAAFLGNLESLRVILQYRPSAFFRIDKLNHAIKLPNEVCPRKNKINLALKNAEKLLEKVKHSTLHAEKMMQIFQSTEPDDSDITTVLNSEFGAIEKSFVKGRKRLPKHISSSDRMKERRKFLAMEKHSIRYDDEKRRNINHLKPALKQALLSSPLYKVTKKEPSDNFADHFCRRLKPGIESHCITVFRDVFSDTDINLGVVKSAGHPVTMKFAPSAQLLRLNLDIEKPFLITPIRSSSSYSIPIVQARSSLQLRRPSISKMSKLSKRALKTLEPGVRGNKKYKDFQLKTNIKVTEQDDNEKHMNKTPLTYAAERGHIECVQFLLSTVVFKRHPSLATKEPLTLATKARSPESILLLLETKVSAVDYQSAVMLSIREMYPDCLTALLTNKNKDRSTLFEGTNLYHILYSQSVISSRRYELMPEMTRALISSKEDVNAHNKPRTFPMYTLISCAFNITVGKQIFFFIDCLHILLECKANPHFDEYKTEYQNSLVETFTRQAFSSAIDCVFESAKNSVNFFESTYWSNIFMKKFITTIELFDITPRRVLNDILFNYMEAICVFGLDRTILRCLLRYGGNPDVMKNGKYPVNVYFDKILPYLTRFEIKDTYTHYHVELNTLMILVKSMRQQCLSHALRIFLSDHLLTAPIQALPITREFASVTNQILCTPRPLMELAAQTIWLKTNRNKKKVKALPIIDSYKTLIIP